MFSTRIVCLFVCFGFRVWYFFSRFVLCFCVHERAAIEFTACCTMCINTRRLSASYGTDPTFSHIQCWGILSFVLFGPSVVYLWLFFLNVFFLWWGTESNEHNKQSYFTNIICSTRKFNYIRLLFLRVPFALPSRSRISPSFLYLFSCCYCCCCWSFWLSFILMPIR